MKNKDNNLEKIANYYSTKLVENGVCPKGVDWNGEVSQHLRFEQLARLLPNDAYFTVNDLGCGYGALFDYLNKRGTDFSYTGIDISIDMIEAAKKRCASNANAIFFHAGEPPKIADFGVASGVFNVKLEGVDGDWKPYVQSMLGLLNKTSRYGFAFNCLTSYSDTDKMKDNLYYADPCDFFEFCKKNYSNQVALLHDYGLYEFTIIVRK